MKKLSFKTLIVLFVLVFSMAALFSACGDTATSDDSSEPTPTAASDASGSTDSTLSGTVSVIGSTSVGPLAEELAQAFEDKNPDVQVDVQAIGSTQGIQAANEGTADIGTSSRELKEEEKAYGLDVKTIAIDGIAVVVHPSNKVKDLTAENIQKIFKGEITNWKDVGGDDKPIQLVIRESGSGTRGAFEELLELEEKQSDGTKKSLVKEEGSIVANKNGEVKTNVSTKENSIGYISMGIVDNTVQAVKVDGVDASVENIKNKTYSLWRPFIMVTKGEPKAPAKAYLDFILSDEGQEIVKKSFICYKAME